MKSHQWDDITDSSKDFFDSVAFIPEPETEDEATDKRVQKRRLTELRRRTEERLDWKRMHGDLQFDDNGDEIRYSVGNGSDDYSDFDDAMDEH
jgi:hypothetical protein